MAEIVTREPLIGGDLDAWGPFDNEFKRLNIGINTRKLSLNGANLVLSKGKIGLFDGAQYYIIQNAADQNLSLAGLTVSLWAKVELSVVAGNAALALTSIVGENDPASLPASFLSAYDPTKGAYYITATKRCLGVVWITAAGAVDGIVNAKDNSSNYQGYAVRNRFKMVDDMIDWRISVITGTGTADATKTLPLLTGLNGRRRYTKEDSGTNKLVIGVTGANKIGAKLTSTSFELYAQGDFVEFEDTTTYWDILNMGFHELAYVPGLTGFGAAVLGNASWIRQGNECRITIKFAEGTPTGVEAQATLPAPGFSAVALVSDATFIPTLQVCGIAILSTAGTFALYALIESAKSYMTFGLQSGSATAINKALGNAIGGAGITLSLTCRIPIGAWSTQ